MPQKNKQAFRKADQYDDPSYNYFRYWQGREYENAAEELAIRYLLKDRSFKLAVDIGGGYGRLCVVLRDYAQKVVLAEPSTQQLKLAKDYLKNYPEIERRKMQADKLEFEDSSVSLLTMIRVMHHLPDPTAEFNEIARVLDPEGYFILEVANFTHALNRLRYLVKAKRMPREPVDIRTKESRKDDDTPFVNHNPATVINQLSHCGLKVERTLSVSNLRSSTIKKLVSKRTMMRLEKFMQPRLARFYFGPSVFFLIKKVN
jgi:ubiquinone/menaquinone biosynthesis C-methylase UbiE